MFSGSVGTRAIHEQPCGPSKEGRPNDPYTTSQENGRQHSDFPKQAQLNSSYSGNGDSLGLLNPEMSQQIAATHPENRSHKFVKRQAQRPKHLQ